MGWIIREQNIFSAPQLGFLYPNALLLALDFAGNGPRRVLWYFAFYLVAPCRSYYQLMYYLKRSALIYFLDFKNYFFLTRIQGSCHMPLCHIGVAKLFYCSLYLVTFLVRYAFLNFLFQSVYRKFVESKYNLLY